MSLDVPAPDPPDLAEAGKSVEDYDDVSVGGGEPDAEASYHRAELDQFLEDGAWERAFNEWAEHTDMSEAEYRVVLDLELLEEFDFFWDDFADRVGYHAPGIPEDWRERSLHPDLDSWGMVSSINASLTELGRTVSDLLRDDYVDWDAEYQAPEDLPEFER